MFDRSPPLQVVGAAVAIVALVGTQWFGWEFGRATGQLPLALGLACAALAVGYGLLRR